MCRKGITLSGGTVLMMERAFTWRNSIPAYAPFPTWRSATRSSGNSVPPAPSSLSANAQRSAIGLG